MLTLLVSPFVKLHNLADSQQTGQRIVKDINSVHNPFTLHQLGTLIAVAVILVLLLPLFLTLLDYLDYRRLQKLKLTYLELTPPSSSSKTALANNQLFAVLHGLYSIRTFSDRLLRRKQFISLEVASSREAGIRFIAVVPATSATAFQQTVTSYLPHVQFKELKDYISGNGHKGFMQLLEFRLWRHFARPLKSHDALAQHDPISFITNSLAKPEPGELLVMQLVLTPADPREARKVHNKLLLGKKPGIMEWSWKLPFILFLKLLALQLKLLGGIVWFITDVFYSDGPSSYHQYERHDQRKNTKALQEIDDRILGKLKQPLFRANVRALIVMQDGQQLGERTNGLLGSLTSFSDPGYQSLRPTKQFLIGRNKKFQAYNLSKFVKRMPSMFRTNHCLLSAEEVANLFHFPYGQATPTENIVKSFSKTLAAPVAIKRHADNEDFDVLLGTNKHHGSETAIGLTADERQRHLYIIGGTGNGKTTMMEYAIVQDIRNGKGVAMIDPHGDSARKILKYIPKERLEDVIYLNPRDLDYPIGLNLLELPEGLTGSELEHEKDRVAEAVISVLHKVFDDNEVSPYRIDRILRNAIHTAFAADDPTLFTVLRLLTDASFRKKVTKNLKDESLKRFWKEELGKAGEFQRVKISGGPISRIERYERSVAARRMLEQPKSTIDFDDILNSGKILICNFSKGRLGEDTSALFGVTILAKLQLAAWRRDEIAEDERTPFYLYVDEFQLFATESFMGLFSEARKYKLFVTIAQQSVSQLKEKAMLNTILDNVGTMVAFRSKSKDTEQLLLHQFRPYIEEGEILNLPAYNFYMKIAAVEPQEPLSGETVVLLKDEADDKRAEVVIQESRAQWAIEYQDDKAMPKEDKTVTSEEDKKITETEEPAYDEQNGDGLLGADAPA
jgi:hypothetical protein